MQKYPAMGKMEKRSYQRLFVILLYLAGGILGLFLFFRYLWKPILPFLFGGLLAAVLQKPLNALDKLTKEKKRIRKMWAVVLVFGSAGAILTVLFLLINVLIDECGTFFAWLGDNIGRFGVMFDRWFDSLESLILLLPLPGNNGETTENILVSILSSADEMFVEMIQGAVSAMTAKLPTVFTAVAAALPQIVLFLAVFLLAAVYLTMEYRSIGDFLSKNFPDKVSAVLGGLRSSLVSTILLYGRAYALLCLLTFGELFLGFLILGVDWALGAAILGAAIDLLPVLGTGTLLLPWAVLELIRGELSRGVGLVVLYIIICVVRQILEPKIIGKNIGLHPLAALFSMYVGVKLIGIAGLFLCPMALAVGWRYYEERRV